VTEAGKRRGELKPLHRDARVGGPFRANLLNLSPEQAATALMDRFVTTGCAEAEVADPDQVRTLLRRDCRRRRLRMRTLAVGNLVLLIDDERHAKWLATPDGRRYREQANDAIVEAITAQIPPTPNAPRRRRRSLRALPPL
jgi:hypothetical protein